MAKTTKTVDEYLKQQENAVGKTLGRVRAAIKSAAPMAEEKIGYGIPYYKYNGSFLAFMARKSHCSLVTMSYDIVKKMKNELKPYKVSGTTIHFSLDKALPDALVKKIVKARIKENNDKLKNKPKNKPKKVTD